MSGSLQGNTKGVNYVLSAMNEGLPGNRDSLFTTVGKPKVRMMPVVCPNSNFYNVI